MANTIKIPSAPMLDVNSGDYFYPITTANQIILNSSRLGNLFDENNKFLGTAAAADRLSVSAGSAGQPVYFSSGEPIAIDFHCGNQTLGEHNCNNIDYNMIGYYTSNGPTTAQGATTADGAIYTQAQNTNYAGQIAQDYRNGNLFIRGKNNGTWTEWDQVLTRNNLSSAGAGFVLKTGDTLTGALKWNGPSGDTTWVKGRDNAKLKITTSPSIGYSPFTSIKTATGSWDQGIYNGDSGTESLYFTYTKDANYATTTADWETRICFTKEGYVRAVKVINAVWNDYAECFPRGEETEAGDIVALDLNSDKEQYIKAIKGQNVAIGVHSDSYAQLIGMDEGDSEADAARKFIPVGLAGRVYVKVKEQPKKGDYIGPSEVPGVGEVCDSKSDAIGICVDNKMKDGRIKVKII